jgi:radical SAM protein with 4Fe4S-binding SPASM domain
MGLLNRLFGRRTRAVWRTETWLMHKLGYVRPPEAIQWISTSVCDLKCPHCYSNAGKKQHGELTTDEAITLVLDEMVLMDRPVLVLAGGEALFRKDIPDILTALRDRQIPWAMHSHGGRVPDLRDVFAAYPPIMAAISFDGTPEVHDAFRGKVGSFDNAVRAIRSLKEIGVKEVVAGTTVTRQNADLLADMFPYVLASGADSWGFHLMTPEGRASEHPELLPTIGQLRRAAAFGRRLRSVFHVELDNEWGSAGDDDCYYRDSTFSCGAGRVSCVVSATGELMPCTTTDLAESAGNVRERPLHRLWADGFAAFRDTKDELRSDCNDCWLNTRHGHTCRPAFHLDIFDSMPDGRIEHRIPLGTARMEVSA